MCRQLRDISHPVRRVVANMLQSVTGGGVLKTGQKCVMYFMDGPTRQHYNCSQLTNICKENEIL